MSSARLKTVSTVRLGRTPKEEFSYVPERLMPKSTLPAEIAKDPFIKPSEIAKELKVNVRTVSRWINDRRFGEAPDVIRLPGLNGHRRIRTSAYERAMSKVNDSE